MLHHLVPLANYLRPIPRSNFLDVWSGKRAVAQYTTITAWLTFGKELVLFRWL
jgi:hypothetical protein